MHARFFDPVPFFPFSADMLLLLFVLLCARISIYNVWVCANEINSVALEAKIYYQIKFLTEFIALSLSPNIVLLPFGSLHSPLPTTHKQPPPQPPTQMNPPANEPSSQTPNPSEPSGDPDLSLLFLPHLCNTICTSPTLHSVPLSISLIFLGVFVYKIYREQIWTICAHYFRVFLEHFWVRVPHASGTLSLMLHFFSHSH